MSKFHIAMTDDEADFNLLSLASDKRKFAIPMEVILDAYQQAALERGIDEEWFTLVDVSFVSNALDASLVRIFRLTDKGMHKLARLAKDFGKG